jgi:glycosyltransferase involved in cell wall biosynthesis
MRILEATDCYPPPLVGGRDLIVQLLSRELVARGHEVDVVSLAGSRGPRIDFDGGVRVHRLSGWSRILSHSYADPDKPFHPTLPDPGIVRRLSNILRLHRPQIVHAHSWLLYSLLPLLPSPGTKLVVWVHDQSFICPKTTFVYRGLECAGPKFTKCVGCATEQYGSARSLALTTGMAGMRPWLGRVNRFVANSEATARASAQLTGSRKAQMQVIPPFVPNDAFASDQGKRPAFVPAEGPYLMFAGALGPHKGLDVLLEAWTSLGRSVPLVLAGIRRLDTPRHMPAGVILAEDVPHHDVLRAWGHCTLAVVPSVWPEPFGMVALEAMAAGRAVVASSVGGLAELVVDGTTGLLVPPGDPTALKNAIQRLLADGELRTRLGAAGRERARAYSVDAVVGSWEQVFHDVASSWNPSR